MNAILNKKFGFGAALIFMFPAISYSSVVYCGARTINQMQVQGSRDDGHPHANKLFLMIDGAPCNGQNIVYIENSNSNYKNFLATVTTAYVLGKKIDLYVNSNVTTSGATQISIIGLMK
jgi:hypothetical protein